MDGFAPISPDECPRSLLFVPPQRSRTLFALPALRPASIKMYGSPATWGINSYNGIKLALEEAESI